MPSTKKRTRNSKSWCSFIYIIFVFFTIRDFLICLFFVAVAQNLETSGAYKTGLTTKYLHNGEENGKRNDLTKEFENLTADEILRKCGINDITSSSASSTLTPSSSTHSFSSSNHSIYAIYNSSANGTNGLSAGHAHASRQLRDIEVLKKQL